MKVQYLIVDLFAGAGGTTTGFDTVDINGNNPFKVIVAVNHDHKAIQSHWMNHPEVHHFEEDIRSLDQSKLKKVVDGYQVKYPDAKLILWASLECTNFSKAKGGLPRDADSRTLACSLYKYIDTLDPYYIMIENVVEFMSWGPLDEKGKPISRKNGRDWVRWRNQICLKGYSDSWKELNSANFGAYTSRNRLFGIFCKEAEAIHWPKPTHAKDPQKSMFGGLKKWKPVKHCLDFSDEGQSIFSRKKPLVDKTLERIYAGLVKFVTLGDESFLLKYNSTDKNGNHNAPGIEVPCPTIATQNRLGIVNAVFLQKHFSGKPHQKVSCTEVPAGTITSRANQSIVSASFLQHYYGNGFATGMKEVCPTIRTKDGIGFVTSYYSGGGQVSGLESPSPTITSVPKQRILQTVFIDQQYGNSKPQAVEHPAARLTANPKLAFCKVKPWIMDTSFTNIGHTIENPCGTLVASRRHRYLMNPQYTSKGGSIENPCFTLIARMDKQPPYMITAESGKFGIIINPDDSEIMVKIKKLMAAYDIIDIKMRMLKVPELLKIQGFPSGYKLDGNQTDQKKFIGNAVVPHVVKAMAESIVKPELNYRIAV